MKDKNVSQPENNEECRIMIIDDEDDLKKQNLELTELAEVRARLRMMVKSAKAVTSCCSQNELNKLLLEEFARNMAAEGGSLFLSHEGGLELAYSLDTEHVPSFKTFPLPEDSIMCRVLRERRPILIKNIDKEASVIGSGWEGYKDCSLMVFPLISEEEEIVGIITLHNKRWPPFTKQDLELGLIFVSLSTEVLRNYNVTASLRESELRFRTLVENIPGIVYRCEMDHDWTMHYISDMIEVVSGYPATDFLANRVRTFDSIILPDDREMVSNVVNKAVKRRSSFSIEYRITTADGSIKWIFERGQGVYAEDGNLLFLDGALFDITERMQAEDMLQKSEEKHRRLIENLRDNYFFYVHDIEGVFTYISPSLTNILGYSAEEFQTHYSEFLTDNQINKEVIKHTELSIQGIKQPPYEVEIYHKDGTIRMLQVQETPVFNDNHMVIAVEGIAQDITDRLKMEKELIKIQKLESVGILAGGIAHDFNNSLQAILGYISLAELHANTDSRIKKYLEEARKTVLQSSSLTQQLLTFSKSGAPVKNTLSISELIRDSVRLALSGSNVKCDINISTTLQWVDADKGQLNQVFSNLVINAVQAMPEGGVIKVYIENTNIVERDLLPLQKGRYVKVTVKDHGIGVPKEHLQKIFDPYFTTKQKGNGLGLATTFSIIKKHDGHITVESEIGVGTTFRIYLPASHKEMREMSVPGEVKRASITPVDKTNEKKPNVSKGKVLLMDDEYVIRVALGKHLKYLNYEVEAVEEGPEAIGLYKRAMDSDKPFDAVIIDLTISGGMGGKEVIERLLKIDPEVVAIVMSGYANDQILANYKKYGFRGVLVKPHEIHELDEALQKVMMKELESGTHKQ